MQRIEKYRWKIRWAGRWTTTRVHFTEAEIRREHPEAERDDATRIVVELPDTDEERSAAQQPRGSR